MALSDLINKNKSGQDATAIPAKHSTETPPALARLATLALANPPESKTQPLITHDIEAAILRWLSHIGETDQTAIDDVLEYCRTNPEALAYYLKRAGEAPPPDDRHHCRECLNLNSNGYCTRQRFKPVDDLPRRCDDFTSN